MRCLLRSLLIVSVAACARAPNAAPLHTAHSAPRVVDSPPALSRTELQQLAQQHCARCHQGSVSREKPAALAVFDLDHADWCEGLAAAQFDVFYQRMQGELDVSTRARLRLFTEQEAHSRASQLTN